MLNTTIKGFTLTRKLGEGGMAEVWRASNEIGKDVAIKILRKDLSLNDEFIQRFKNEAKIMVALNHPNIRQVYDIGAVDNRPCIIMEYLEGADLSTRIKNGERFSNDQLIEWWDQIVDALNYTHAKGVVHRDIKPSNFFITTNGNLKLLDFGIAKIRRSVTITQTGSRMGTLLYMSPEQVKDSKHLDYRTDLYSLAVSFYHLLTGFAPYDNTKSSEFEIQSKIVHENLKLDKLPQTWRSFLSSYLEKDPLARPKLTNFPSIAKISPLPSIPRTQPRLGPETEIKVSSKRTHSSKSSLAPDATKSYTAYWLFAVAAMVIVVFLIVFSNGGDEKDPVVKQQSTEQLEHQRQADENAWKSAKSANTKTSYEQYLRDHPQGKYVSDARSMLNDEVNELERNEKQVDQNAWNTARNTNTKAAYEKYLRDYPAGNFVSEARTKISEIDKAIKLATQGRPVIEWVYIPSGTFSMGSPASEKDRDDDETLHQVTLSAFKISKYEITFEQYDAFCNATGRSKPDDEGWGRGKRPVINLSWDDAKAFADWMGCRLPTEAEWEYAARAGTTTPFNTGNCLSTSQANYNGNYPYSGCSNGEFRGKTLPVGSFAPNAWGLHDMHGNVWEWCSDWYDTYPSGAQTNPKGPTTGSNRLLRGGSWFNDARICRSAFRYSTPDNRNNSIGFRLVAPR